MTCQTAQGLYMEFIFGFSVKTVKVRQWAGGELWCMATTSGTALRFYEIKNLSHFFNILIVQKHPVEFDYHQSFILYIIDTNIIVICYHYNQQPIASHKSK